MTNLTDLWEDSPAMRLLILLTTFTLCGMVLAAAALMLSLSRCG